jgi:hypothetical protein
MVLIIAVEKSRKCSTGDAWDKRETAPARKLRTRDFWIFSMELRLVAAVGLEPTTYGL